MKHIQSFNSYNNINEEIKIPGKELDINDLAELLSRFGFDYHDVLKTLKEILKDSNYNYDKISQIFNDATNNDPKILYDDDRGYFMFTYPSLKHDKFKYGLKYE